MKNSVLAPWVLAISLAACSGNPLNGPDDDTGTDTGTGTGDGGGSGTGDGGGITSDRALPPGTDSPSKSTGIYRTEAPGSGEQDGNGYARDITYNSENDTFFVSNLAFDGSNSAYTRGTAGRVSSLGPYAVYEGPEFYPDSVTGEEIGQFLHRAIYAVSKSGNTEFAIVRTGSYVPYGFGGYVYQRNGSVTLPTTGQASYNGDYAALRDFSGKGGIEYSTGDMRMEVDFRDFEATSGTYAGAVRGYVTNRAIFDVNGRDITKSVLDSLSEVAERPISRLPTLVFAVGPGVLDVNGEMVGGLGSTYVNGEGKATEFETGNFYAIMSDGKEAGQEASEVVGVIVVEGTDPRDETKFRETGGFILERNPAASN